MSVTIPLRTLVAFAAGLAIATIMFFAFQAITADAVDSNEATFVPITPCRLFDTRPGATNVGPRSSPLQADSSYFFQVTGSNGDCAVPAAATAVSINLTGVAPSAATNLRLYPADAAVPNASVLNMTAGQAPTPNKLDVKLSPDGKLAIYNRFGTIHVVGDVMGYYRHDGLADLEARLVALEADNATLKADVAALKTKTASMSTVIVDAQPTVRFRGVNVQIVSGSGTTDGAVNGKGNLIVGYNENVSDTRTGSHNLIVGPNHSYSSFGGFIAGYDNRVDGPSSSVTGGQSNTANGTNSSVTGGNGNIAGGDLSSASGGNGNTASGTFSSVTGGNGNTANGTYSSVSGGVNNSASSAGSSVSGGINNTASGPQSSVSGGILNTASGLYSSVSGGDFRFAPGTSNWAAGALFQSD